MTVQCFPLLATRCKVFINTGKELLVACFIESRDFSVLFLLKTAPHPIPLSQM